LDRNVSYAVTIMGPNGDKIAFYADLWSTEKVSVYAKGEGSVRVCIRSNSPQVSTVREEIWVHPIADDTDEPKRSEEWLSKESSKQESAEGAYSGRGTRPDAEALELKPKMADQGATGVEKPQGAGGAGPDGGTGAELALKSHGATAVAFADHVWGRLDDAKSEMDYLKRRLRRHERTLASNDWRFKVFGWTEMAIFVALAAINVAVIRFFFADDKYADKFGGGF